MVWYAASYTKTTVDGGSGPLPSLSCYLSVCRDRHEAPLQRRGIWSIGGAEYGGEGVAGLGWGANLHPHTARVDGPVIAGEGEAGVLGCQQPRQLRGPGDVMRECHCDALVDLLPPGRVREDGLPFAEPAHHVPIIGV